MNALEKIRARIEAGGPVLLDGATGTELARRGVDTSPPLWSACGLLEKPDIVREVHADYIRAGADIVTANTFRTARCTLEEADLEELADALPDLAVTLLLEAIQSEGAEDRVVPAGCISPLSDNHDPHRLPPSDILVHEHREHAVRQALAGAEMILCETMVTVKEAVIAVSAANETGLPVCVSFVAKDSRHLLSGETLDTAVRAVEPLEPFAIGLNCCSIGVINGAISTLRSLTNLPVCAYAHIGAPNKLDGWTPDLKATPIEYAKSAEGWHKKKVQLIGGCCGTTPEFIKHLHQRLFANQELKK